MTYTVATLEVPSETYLWIKAKLADAGYNRFHGDVINMHQIGIKPMTGFEFEGNESASLNDILEHIVEEAFTRGYAKGLYTIPSDSNLRAAMSDFTESEEFETMQERWFEAFNRMRNELACNIEARNEPYQSLIKRAAAALEDKSK